ncbi:hypothetical protein DPEC_G00152300 [Dallia pectoralis]|uniref:Uncharacterized protein n=1 Tax=Dallia pectoralis TaxID=75939 RepID=A0ACC2GJM4_DALPE|nr:hypothetical protein DPEC_G00152300 [Dallia pectoralis]
MDPTVGEVEVTGEITGKKMSRFKLLKSRLFGRLRRKDMEGLMKQSQSASDVTNDVTAQRVEVSEEDCLTSLGTLGFRAMSHDSIFLADQSQSSTEPTRVLSQENVHEKIRKLQLKLQQKNMQLGPPPLLITGKRMEDSGTTSEDDGLPQSPPEISFYDRVPHGSSYKFTDTQRHHSSLSLAGTGSEEEEQPSSRPLSPITAPPCDLGLSPAADFTSPAQYTPSLDSSAARHRMSVKPRNQRASTKGRKGPLRTRRSGSESLSDLDQPLSEMEEDQEGVEDEENEEDREQPLPSSPKDSEFLWKSVPPGGHIEKSRRQESSEPERHITSNPLYLQPMPFDADLFSPSEPITESPGLDTASQPTLSSTTVEESHKLQEPFRVQPNNQKKKDILACSFQGSRPRSTSERTLSSPLSSVYTSDIVADKRDSLNRNIQKVSHEDPSSTNNTPQHSNFPVSDQRFRKPTPASEKESFREPRTVPSFGNYKKIPKLDLAQMTTGTPSGQEDKPSGSHSLSVSSKRQRPKITTGSGNAGTGDGETNLEDEGGDGLIANKVKQEETTSKAPIGSHPFPSTQRRIFPDAGLREEEKCDVHSERKQEEERSAFGVKLRTTSHSLKYRSERDQEVGIQRYSAEFLDVSTAGPAKGESDTGCEFRCDSANKALKKHSTQVTECTPSSMASLSNTSGRIRQKDMEKPLKLNDNDDIELLLDAFLVLDDGSSSRPLELQRGTESPESTGSAGSVGSEPVWMSMARGKTRTLSSESGTGGKTTPQQIPAPRQALTSDPQPRFQPTSLHPTQPPSRPQPSTQTAPKKQTSRSEVQPSSQAIPSTRANLRGLQLTAKLKTSLSEQPHTQPVTQPTQQVTDEQIAPVSCQPHLPTSGGASKTSSTYIKRSEKTLFTGSKTGSDSLHTEIDIEKTDVSSSSSPLSSQSSSPHRGQPTWMELAKRKSLAWSNKTKD